MKSVRQMARETEIVKPHAHRLLKRVPWRCHIPTLMHDLNEDDPDRGIEFCEWYLGKYVEDAAFPSKNARSDEAIFKLNGSINYWATKNPYVTMQHHLNFQGLQCSVGYQHRRIFLCLPKHAARIRLSTSIQ